VSVISLSGNAVRTTLHQSAPFVTAQRGDIDLSYRRPRRGPRAFRGIENDNEARDDRGAWGGGGGGRRKRKERRIAGYCNIAKKERPIVIALSWREARQTRLRRVKDALQEAARTMT